MIISNQLLAAFAAAKTRLQDLAAAWVKISFNVGNRLPASLLSPDIQRYGDIDLLVRCMEDERAQKLASIDMFAYHYQKLMSDYWIGSMYEIFRLLRQRGLADADPAFNEIFSDLELIRMPLEKFELAKDKKLGRPLEMTRLPERNDESDKYVYDKNDDLRSHIMPTTVSENGSVEWHVHDVIIGENRWVQRRNLSDRIIKLWKV
jgi:hypothetical protein